MSRLAILVCLLFFCPVSLQSACAGGPVVPLVTGEWPPYVSQELPGQGPITEIVVAALAAVGCRASVQFAPWKRCEWMLAEGKAFGAFPYVRNVAREKTFAFSQPFIRLEDRFFYLKGRLPGFDYKGSESLRSLLIGGAIGYHYEQPLREAGLRVDWASDIRASFRQLIAGRVDVVIEERWVGQTIVSELLGDQACMVGMTRDHFSLTENSLMVSRAYPDSARLLLRFNQGLEKIRADGTYARILQRHGIAE